MTITVKLFAQYREGRFKSEIREYANGTKASTIIQELGIDKEALPLGVLLVNGRHKDEFAELKEGDVLSLFPKVGGG